MTTLRIQAWPEFRMLWCGGIVALLVTALAFSPERLSRDTDWEVWKTTHKKQYSSLEEEEQRRSVWEKNTLLIEAHNLEYEQGMHSYQLGMNHLGDMTAEEVAEKMTGLVVPQARKTNNTFTLDDIPTKLPKAIDYRILGYVTPVINQGSCQSCWAISAAGALEGQLMRSRRKLEQNCTFNRSDSVAQIWDFMELPEGNERVLRAVVAVHGPVSVGINTRSPNFTFYKSGKARAFCWEGTMGTH
ncbi:hypothetical protein ANANG_G00181040 [Anguilla anguilla]|uniref:Cystein proteinase inhibitor protein salarin n=1 Tax=Anguilla anguilla TaxID=7936 RepID=A0A9D3M6J1_ANGAN|nr:hypothetical protein ANANG_G00181040 [Anguilla anguilla]